MKTLTKSEKIAYKALYGDVKNLKRDIDLDLFKICEDLPKPRINNSSELERRAFELYRHLNHVSRSLETMMHRFKVRARFMDEDF